MNESEDYNRGYRDGFNAAKRPHAVPPPNLTGAPVLPPTLKCCKCNIEFQGAVGYYCPHTDCPTFIKTTC
jgi:hypothetical protein